MNKLVETSKRGQAAYNDFREALYRTAFKVVFTEAAMCDVESVINQGEQNIKVIP